MRTALTASVANVLILVCAPFAGCSSSSPAQTQLPAVNGPIPAGAGMTLPPPVSAGAGVGGLSTAPAVPAMTGGTPATSAASGAPASAAGGPAAGASVAPAGAAGSGGVVSVGAGGMAGVAAGASGGAAGAAGASPEAGACTGAPLSAGDHKYQIASKNGIMYEYILSVPKSVDPLRRTPLLVHWHALSSSPEEARMLTSVDAKAEAARMLVVYPRSPDESWDVGSCCTNIKGGMSRDETVFARELIADVESKACVDDKRIYTNGFSNGGMISQLLACKLPDVFAAAAPMGSTLTIDASMCSPSRPIPIFMVNGTADPLVGYDATGTSGGLSAVADVKFWADKNKCTGTPEGLFTKGKAKCSRYTQCASGAEVAFCSVDGMGHCVPGMLKESATNCLTKSAFGLPLQLGAPNDDIDAIQMGFDFLQRFTLP